jgi:hypothetical protein
MASAGFGGCDLRLHLGEQQYHHRAKYRRVIWLVKRQFSPASTIHRGKPG